MQTFQEFAAANGVLIDSIVHGKIVRCPTKDHPHKKNGAALFNGEYGWVQNWVEHPSPIFWKSKKERSKAEHAELDKRITASKLQYALERAKTAQEAARKAHWVLSQCELTTHAYMARKGFDKLPVNVWMKNEPLLVIPMYHKNAICGCQIINEAGDKKFLTGQRTSNAYFKIGDGKDIFICEGFASAHSLQDVLSSIGCQSTVYIAFSAGNATKLAKQYPTARWIADHDTSGVGQAAAEESGLRWWMPLIEGMDVNDLVIAQGKFKTGMQLKKFLMKG